MNATYGEIVTRDHIFALPEKQKWEIIMESRIPYVPTSAQHDALRELYTVYTNFLATNIRDGVKIDTLMEAGTKYFETLNPQLVYDAEKYHNYNDDAGWDFIEIEDLYEKYDVTAGYLTMLFIDLQTSHTRELFGNSITRIGEHLIELLGAHPDYDSENKCWIN